MPEQSEISPVNKAHGPVKGSRPHFVVAGDDEESDNEENIELHNYPRNTTDQDGDATAMNEKTEEEPPKKSKNKLRQAFDKQFAPYAPSFTWITGHNNWKSWRPVIRCSFSAWIGLILVICTKPNVANGNAAFLILIVALITAPASPIGAALPFFIYEIVLISLTYVFGIFVVAVAHASRTEFKMTYAEFQAASAAPYIGKGMTTAEMSTAIQRDIFSGKFLEVRSSAVYGLFFSLGGGFFLWYRGYLGPTPKVIAVILALILLIIICCTSVLFPYPAYEMGLAFYKPFLMQTAVNLFCTLFIFPETLAHSFSEGIIGTLAPLQSIIQAQKGMLHTNPLSEDWLKFQSVRTDSAAALSSLARLKMAEPGLNREVSIGRIPAKDLKRLSALVSTMVNRASGFINFYDIVAKHLHRSDPCEADRNVLKPIEDAMIVHLGHKHEADTETPSRIPSLASVSRAQINDHSDNEEDNTDDMRLSRDPAKRSRSGLHLLSGDFSSKNRIKSHGSGMNAMDRTASEVPVVPGLPRSASAVPSYLQRDRRSRSRGASSRNSSHAHLASLLHDVLHPNITKRPVGLFESQRYMDLEDMLGKREDEGNIEVLILLLATASESFIDSMEESVGHVISTLDHLKSKENMWVGLFHIKTAKENEDYDQRLSQSQALLIKLKTSLVDYVKRDRLRILKPFFKVFDPLHQHPSGIDTPDSFLNDVEPPSHRGLYWIFMYQFTLIQCGKVLVELLEETVKIERKRRTARVWWPRITKTGWLGSIIFSHESEQLHGPEENGGFDLKLWNGPDANDSFFTTRRHPDYDTPKNMLHILGHKLYSIGHRLTKNDALFAVKAAFLIGVCCIPCYMKSSSWFFQRERGLWAIIMAILTFTPYIGDTTFGFIIRIVGTFIGATVGLLAWTIAAPGNGNGNPYGLAAVCAVLFPFLFFVRLYYLPVPAAILPTVTCILVLGFSWQDGHHPMVTSPGVGFNVAWRRFVLVTVGISIAFIWTYLPPKMTQKEAIRKTFSKSLDEVGELMCGTVSYGLCWDPEAKKVELAEHDVSADPHSGDHAPASERGLATEETRGRSQDATQVDALERTQSVKRNASAPRAPEKADVREDAKNDVTKIPEDDDLNLPPDLKPPKALVDMIVGLRVKLNRTNLGKAMVKYEVSMRGKWPAATYTTLLNNLMELLENLAILMGVITSLNKTWRKALLKRTQISSPEFLGQLLSSIELMSICLRDAIPLPMVYRPLLEQFLNPIEVIRAHRPYGFDISLSRQDADAELNLPQHVDMSVICSLEYLRFSCGVSCCYAIFNRLDRLMLIVKSLVGEKYIVYGLNTGFDEESAPLMSYSAEGANQDVDRWRTAIEGEFGNDTDDDSDTEVVTRPRGKSIRQTLHSINRPSRKNSSHGGVKTHEGSTSMGEKESGRTPSGTQSGTQSGVSQV